ncbi:uncharacterized protein LOC129572325 [Sitodiplosis mosellana]|uniref:uncharacterized protein LOC129572325 n=1 Tax=Sitodiplosis mosellana TaxID=263140 RepID=UPI0024444FA5|nr:uncharacterized protein LOC129572325 [Sitodiplosis mosellana]
MNNPQNESAALTINKSSNNTDKKHEHKSRKPPHIDTRKSRKIKNKPKMAQQQDPNVRIFELMREQVKKRLECCEPGRELEVLQTSLMPDYRSLWLKCMEVKNDLLFALQRFYPFVRLEVFGSTVMGIAFRDSDFDFFIELSRQPLNAKPAAIIGKAMNILRTSGQFTNFLPISHARVPILKCYHIRTSMAVDINFSDSYGILNSPIVARLLTFDNRIYVLSVIIKFWGKVQNCVGKNRISNYAIVWMLIFYLQQQQVLPAIAEFQHRVHPYLVNHYNFAFDDRLNNQKRCSELLGTSELLLGFFKFYRSFDFESHVICPLYGRAFRKADIMISNKLPEFRRYHDLLAMNQSLSPMQFNKCICIQDPFESILEITHSIPGIIANLEFQKIVWKFEYAAETIEAELQTEGESTKFTGKLLMFLFDAEKCNQWLQQKMSKCPVNKTRSLQETTVLKQQSSTSACCNVITIKPTENHLSMIREMSVKKRDDSNATKIDNRTIHLSWSEFVIESVILILRDIFMLEMEKLSMSETPSTSVNMNAECSDDNEAFTKEFNITGSRDVFLGRKQTKKITVNTLNLEKLESQERYKQSLEIQLKAVTKIRTDINNFDEVTIEFHDLIKTKKNNSFRTFFTNFDQNLNNLLKIYLVHKCGTIL